MSRDAVDRLGDILDAIDRCVTYRVHLDSLDEAIASMAYDAVLRNLAVIGEAVKTLPDESRALSPETPWSGIAGLRNVVVHEYFRVERDLVLDILENELEPLATTIRRHLAG
ncbi:MAG TPA: HepT-like ribonuclease domain-containing protein [Marmoricola sp.]|nr:HepT-like ribonuclease domain-containing protein [Marmoricola sp.]